MPLSASRSYAETQPKAAGHLIEESIAEVRRFVSEGISEAVHRLGPRFGEAAALRRRSRAYAVHDYMHANFIVAHEHVVSGRYNLSRHGEINAENVVHIVSDLHASHFVEFADRIAARYRA